ncbi:hypothetical protein DFJ73DRAFT_920983 [Zopfochytrium polystomum]|nr:hypothetical protein DFJ73DRAFT_920983 [Zopfochytrium polystomum]
MKLLALLALVAALAAGRSASALPHHNDAQADTRHRAMGGMPADNDDGPFASSAYPYPATTPRDGAATSQAEDGGRRTTTAAAAPTTPTTGGEGAATTSAVGDGDASVAQWGGGGWGGKGHRLRWYNRKRVSEGRRALARDRKKLGLSHGDVKDYGSTYYRKRTHYRRLLPLRRPSPARSRTPGTASTAGCFGSCNVVPGGAAGTTADAAPPVVVAPSASPAGTIIAPPTTKPLQDVTYKKNYYHGDKTLNARVGKDRLRYLRDHRRKHKNAYFRD